MSDLDYIQDLFDCWAIGNRIGATILASDYVNARRLLATSDGDPQKVVSGLRELHISLGTGLLALLIDTDDISPATGIDDVWPRICPCPDGLSAAQADVPAGTIPLWTNGSDSVFCRKIDCGGGVMDFEFGVSKGG